MPREMGPGAEARQLAEERADEVPTKYLPRTTSRDRHMGRLRATTPQDPMGTEETGSDAEE